jgi:hypothetical protein
MQTPANIKKKLADMAALALKMWQETNRAFMEHDLDVLAGVLLDENKLNDYEKEIKLGGDEYMLIELDYPLGDLYPYEKAAVLEYELIIEFKCKNITNGKCLNNDNEPLDYLNDAGIISTIRFFAEGCQTFEKDVEIEAKFKY